VIASRVAGTRTKPAQFGCVPLLCRLDR
jgi:hypothetical protein